LKNSLRQAAAAAVLLLALLTVSSTASAASTTINPATLPAATVGVAYGATITVNGPRSPYTIRVTQGSLPLGLTLTGGSLTGAPTTAATFMFTISAYAGNGQPPPRRCTPF
jgi:large repetitive protein